ALILHDVLFDQNGQARFNPFNTDGLLGDQITVNRTIRPRLEVKRRRYRFRILNGGPSRFYQVSLMKLDKNNLPEKPLPITMVTSDGNLLPHPLQAESIFLSVAQRADVIIDFKDYQAGDQLVLLNLAEQTNGKGPSGRTLKPDPLPKDLNTYLDYLKKNPEYVHPGIIRFDVVGGQVADLSKVPDEFRHLPWIDMTEVKRERLWVFDYDGGLWTVNGKVTEAKRIDARVENGTADS